MHHSIVIRRATQDDAADIQRIYNYAILHTTATFDIEPKTLADRVEWLKKHTDAYPVIIALIDSKIVGWAAIGPYGERKAFQYSVENAVYIDCDYQGRGVGSALLAELLKLSEELGYHAVIALVVGDNESSVKLHEKFGFAHVGTMREVGWKFDKWLDLLIYEIIIRN